MDSPERVLLTAVAALVLLVLAVTVVAWRSRPRMFGTLNLLLFVTGLGGAALLAAVGMNVWTYQRLGAERVLCELQFTQLEPRRYRATLSDLYAPDEQVYELAGDEWQLDARVVKWTGPAVLLGFDALYRLERLSGRYRDLDAERHAPRTVYGLAPDRGLDLWQLLGRWKRFLPWLDAYYGSAAYLPMADGARYRVSLTQSGLIARPLNQAARDAVDAWQ